MSTRNTTKRTRNPQLRGPMIQHPDGSVVAPQPLDIDRILAKVEQLNEIERATFLCTFAHSLTVDTRALLLDRPIPDTDLDRVHHINEFLHQLTSCVNARQRPSSSRDVELVRTIIEASHLYRLESAVGRALAAAYNTVGHDKSETVSYQIKE